MENDVIEIDKLELAFQKATDRAIKIHNALEVPYLVCRDGKAVEMLNNNVIRVIQELANH